MSRRRGATAATLAGLCLVSACTGTSSGDTAWPSTDAPLDTDGLVWAAGNDVHLPDGSTITLEEEIGSYVVAGPGVWFAAAGPDELEPGQLPELRFANDEGVRATGAHPGIGTLTTSHDGRWLAFIDRLDDGAGRAEAVVVDLTTGEEVVRSDEGLVPEDDADVDWIDLYEDSPVSMLGVVDDLAYVSGGDTLIVYDLTTGESTASDLTWNEEMRESDWMVRLNPSPPLWNDDGSWQIPVTAFGEAPTLESAEGDRVEASLPEPDGLAGRPSLTGPPLEDFAIGGWLDDSTVIGITPSRDGLESDWRQPALVTCTVPTGECTLMAGTEDGVTLPADRPFGLPREDSLAPS